MDHPPPQQPERRPLTAGRPSSHKVPAMPADAPTILATSGGLRRGARSEIVFAPLLRHAIELAGVDGRAPRLCHVGTAGGDQRWFQAWFSEAGREAGVDVTHLQPVPDAERQRRNRIPAGPRCRLGEQQQRRDLLALWRVHDLEQSFRQAWEAGVVLTGVSAGSVCWHAAHHGLLRSGPAAGHQRPGLPAVLERRPLRLRGPARPSSRAWSRTGRCRTGTPPTTASACSTRHQIVALTEVPGQGAYRVTRDGDQAREERIEPRLLPRAA